MRKQSEPLESLHAQPRGLQADTSAVAVAEHCSFINDLSSNTGLAFAAQTCVMRDESYQLAAATNVALSCLLQPNVAYFACHYACNSASQSSSSIAQHSLVFSRF